MNIIQILRSSTAGNVPAAATPAGSPWVNWADGQFGVADGTVPQRLLAVRFWLSTATYAVNDVVISAGVPFRCIAPATGAGQAPPNATYWAAAGGAVSSVAGKIGVVTLDHNDITDWAATLLPYALLAGPTFTGAAHAPTVTPGTDNSTLIATTAFVQSAIGAVSAGVTSLTGAAPILVDVPSGAVTLSLAANGVANAFLATAPANTFKGNATGAAANVADVPAATVLTTIGAYPAANPSGYITAAALPGPATVQSPMDGAGAIGTSTLYAREDHQHLSDTTKASLAGAAFTGAVTVPAPANPTDAATKTYVDAQIAALSLYKGVYNATTNTPALNPPVGFVAGDYVIVNVAGSSVAGIPGVTTGTALGVGDLLFYDGTNFGHLVGAGLTAAVGDARYLTLAGGQTMTGFFNLAGDPTTALQSVTLNYLQNYDVDAGTF